jgi:hypothetical protein
LSPGIEIRGENEKIKKKQAGHCGKIHENYAIKYQILFKSLLFFNNGIMQEEGITQQKGITQQEGVSKHR